jgi:hypothetical protein
VVVPFGVASTVHAAAGASKEVARVRAHFDSVLTELTARDASSLTGGQRANRATLIAELARYRDRGAFPHNYDFPGRLVPYFVDRKTGAMCAVANLLAATGRRDIVDRVAAANNNVWVDDLQADTAFTRWLDDNGLTLSEAARIQIVYDNSQTPVEMARQVSYIAIAPLAIVSSASMTLWNLTGNSNGHRPGASWTGMMAGALGVGAGGLLMTHSSASPDKVGTLGLVTAGTGLLSMVAAGSAMHAHHQRLAAERDSTRRPGVTDASIGPFVAPTGSTGIGMSFRF